MPASSSKKATGSPAPKPTTTPAPPPPPKPPPTTDLDQSLAAALQFPLIGLDARIEELAYTWSVPNLDVTGNFYYLTFRDGKPSVEEFVDYIYGRVTYFCLPRQERKRLHDLYRQSGDDRYLIEMVDKARDLLIKASRKNKSLGEPGELVLFILLEAMLKAPRIACKMYLKTSQQMPVHGSDAIHVLFDKATQTLTLYWGESKVYATLLAALDRVCGSIKEFVSPKKGKIPRVRDISIVKDHMDVDDPPTKQALIEFFDPYSTKSNSRREVYACFVGFKFDFFGKKIPKAQVEALFKAEYLTQIQEACDQFKDKIVKKNLNHLNFHFFLIPFECVDKLRHLFLTRLGVDK